MPTSFAKTSQALQKHVKKYVELNFTRSDGSTLRQHIAKLKETLANPAIPPSMRASIQTQIDDNALPPVNTFENWLLDRFWELDSTRGQSQAGSNPLTFADINAYAEAFDEDLESTEVQILKAVDNAYLNAVFAEQSKQTGG